MGTDGAASMEGFEVFGTTTAVVGLLGELSGEALSVGRLSDDLNLEESDLADIDSLPLDLVGCG